MTAALLSFFDKKSLLEASKDSGLSPPQPLRKAVSSAAESVLEIIELHFFINVSFV